jgi:hypothetical protein
MYVKTISFFGLAFFLCLSLYPVPIHRYLTVAMNASFSNTSISASACSASTIPYPVLYGAEFLSLEANLVTNYSKYVNIGYYSNHGSVNVTDANFCNVTLSYTHPVGCQRILGMGETDQAIVPTTCTANGTCTGGSFELAQDWIKLFILKNANADISNMTHEESDRIAHDSVQQYDSIIGTNDLDLSQFRARGRKMISYHGMVSQVLLASRMPLLL